MTADDRYVAADLAIETEAAETRGSGAFVARLRSATDAAANSLEQRPRLYLFHFISVYLLITLAHAKRHFWYDEFFTLYISRLPHLSDIWAALRDGLDFNPPMVYLSTRLSHHLFGIGPVSTRLPEMAGFLTMTVCILMFVRRRCGLLFALAAMAFPLITGAYAYASEARAYGIVLGFCGLAGTFWQRAAMERERKRSLAALAVSVCGLALTHCYAVLIVSAFVVAEVTRLATRKKTDWPLWFCLFLPWLCDLTYLPMLHNLKGYAIDSISFRSGVALAPRFYAFLFNDLRIGPENQLSHETIWPLLLVLLIALFCRAEPEGGKHPVERRLIPLHEIAYLGTLCMLPVFGQILAGAFRAPFLDRYALSAVIGFSGLLAFLVFHVTCGSRRAAALMFIVFSTWFAMDSGVWFRSLFGHELWDLPRANLAALPKDELIAISDPLMFLEADYYQSPEVAARLRFLTDRKSALRYTGTDMFDRGYYTMRRWFPIKGQIAEYPEFTAANKRFFVYGPFVNPEDWLLRRLTEEGARIEMKGQFKLAGSHGDENILLEVRAP